jgi:potassium voltage-gated channel Eag-related subfamily H protein 8
MITYFIGCMVFFISNEFNNDQDIADLNTFNTNFEMYEYKDNKSRLAVVCYFALTMLSTVGYGDYYPISNLEMISAVVIMMGGVAFFSFIMGNFIEIISTYESKMGSPDKMPDLNKWLTSLERFNDMTPLRMS